MRKINLLFAALLAAHSIYAQAVYPGNIATDGDILVARNLVQTGLAQSIDSSQVAIQVTSPSGIVANMTLSIEKEIVKVVGVNGNNITVARGFDGSTAAAHVIGSPVSGYIVAKHHNALADEVKAIEAALGPNLSNVGAKSQFVGTIDATTGLCDFTSLSGLVDGPLPTATTANNGFYVVATVAGTVPSGPIGGVTLKVGDWVISNGSSWSKLSVGAAGSWLDLTEKPLVDARQFQFARTNGNGAAGDLSATGPGKTILLSPCPAGIDSSSPGLAHRINISGGVGTPEIVPITAFSAASPNCTITVTTGNIHTGTWSATSATGGGQEAHNFSPIRSIVIYSGLVTVQASVFVQKAMSFQGMGAESQTQIIQETANTPAFVMGSTGASGGLTVQNLTFSTTSAPWASRGMIESYQSGEVTVSNVRVYGFNGGGQRAVYHGVAFSNCITCKVLNTRIEHTAGHGINAVGTGASTKTGDMWVTGSTIADTGGDGIHLGTFVAGVYIRHNEFFGMQNSDGIDIDGTDPGDCCYYIQDNDMSVGSADGGLNARAIHASARGTYQITGNNFGANQNTAVVLDTGSVFAFLSGNAFGCPGRTCLSILTTADVVGNFFNGSADPASVAISVGAAGNFVSQRANKFSFFSGSAVTINAAAINQTFTGNVCEGCGTFATYTGTGLTGGNNTCTNCTVPSLASAAAITLNITSDVFQVTGTTPIATINGGWAGRQVTIYFTNAAPGGVVTGGNINRTQTAVQYQSLILTYDGSSWF